MAFLGTLWLPILLSAAICFFLSAIFWMVGPHHQKEFIKHPAEDAILNAVRAHPGAVGRFVLPGVASNADRNAAWKEKVEAGPTALVTVRPQAPMTMGKQLVQSFLSNVLISVFCAYVASHALAPTASYLEVFRIVGVTGFMSYAFGSMYDSVWFGRPWNSFAWQCVDALIYGCMMGGVFGWRWH